MPTIIDTLDKTQALAREICAELHKGDVIFFNGPVGIGKSTLIKYILAEFGYAYRGSPTFGLMNIYSGELKFRFRHIDLYNNPHSNVIREIGDVDEDILLIEWAELSKTVAEWFPNALHVNMGIDDSGQRFAEIVR